MHRRPIHLAFLFVSGLVLTSVARGADPSLVGWWAMDETSGTTAYDSSGLGNHGTLVNGPQWVPGHAGGALLFDGVDDYVDIPTLGSVITTLRESTFAIWVNWAGGGAWQRIYDIGTGSITNYCYIYLCPSTGTTNALRVAIVAGNGTWDEFDSKRAALAPGWHHITVTISAASRTMVMYLDGEPIGSMMNMTNNLSDLGNTSQNLLGKSTYVADPNFNGMLDDFRIYNRVLTRTEVRQLMRGMSELAVWESPKDKSTDVERDVILGWAPGYYAKTHDVYIGTSLEDVTAATRTDQRGVLASQNQDANTCDPAGLLDFNQTYTWRVDEVNAPPTDSTIFTGKVWKFTTEPYAYPIKPASAKASSFYQPQFQPSKTIDGSGLNENDGHATTQQYMWLSSKTPQPVWIQYDFDRAYKLHQMWVWNYNQTTTTYGAKEVAITTSMDGTTWTPLANVPEFAQAPGEPNYLHNTTVDFGGVVAQYVKLTINSNWGHVSKQAGLSEVRFYQAPLYARDPDPNSGSTNVALETPLHWRPGREAALHEIYLGLDSNEVLNGTVPTKTVAENRVPLTLLGAEYDRTYYWKVNEVNAAATFPTWPGQEVWSFSTTAYSVIDDFEAYTDAKGSRIFDAWVDGYGTTTNGSVVGNPDQSYAPEMTIVHGGSSQSMPFFYDNTLGAALSEATRTFGVPQDWTQGGAKTLVLFFRGDWANGVGQLYVKVNGTQLAYQGDTNALARPLWKQWNVDLTSVADRQAVKTLTIGVSGSVRGKLIIDDIRLYRDAPPVPVPLDPGTTGLEACYTFENDAKDSSSHKYDGKTVNDPRYVDSLPGLGKAIELDGVNDYVELPIGTLVSTLTSTTIATWLNFDTGSTGAWQRVFDFGTFNVDVNGVDDPNFYMFLSPRIMTNGVIRFAITTNGNAAGAESLVSSVETMASGWAHLAVVINDGTDANTVQLYLNGEVVARGTTATLPRDLGVTDQNWLGRSQYDVDGYLGGAMDEFRIYNRVLSVPEIRYLAGDR